MPFPKLGQAIVACALVLTILGTQSHAGTVTGTAAYRERIAVPPDATLYVELQGVSLADAPAVSLAAKRYAMDSVPAQFELTFDDELIKDGHRYVVRASISQGQDLLFTTDTAYPVLTDGAGNSADLMLVQVQGGSILDDTQWTAAALNGTPIEAERRPEINFAQDGAFSGSGGCNRFNGQADISGATIAFPDNMAATLMACPPALEEVERQFFQALQSATTYAVEGDALAFLDAAGEPVVKFVRTR
ncbi:heat-inducible protein [Ruegeria denitrificans]|uniref:Heat-inducible protein n=1 Tax=Ruegeria denitrificans TaxID=1715692 RepID=A0A0P1I1W6_9RHOB|nr:YbaY family lipoprotein [Ruegeria denitrificans]CUJ85742.1 heat-inducible protein [Ruegeria denitrificans]